MEEENWKVGNWWTWIQKVDPKTGIGQFGTPKRYWKPEIKSREFWKPKYRKIGFGRNLGSDGGQRQFNWIKRKINNRKKWTTETKPANDKLANPSDGGANEFSKWGAAETQGNEKEIRKLDLDRCWERYCYSVVEWVA